MKISILPRQQSGSFVVEHVTRSYVRFGCNFPHDGHVYEFLSLPAAHACWILTYSPINIHYRSSNPISKLVQRPLLGQRTSALSQAVFQPWLCLLVWLISPSSGKSSLERRTSPFPQLDNVFESGKQKKNRRFLTVFSNRLVAILPSMLLLKNRW